MKPTLSHRLLPLFPSLTDVAFIVPVLYLFAVMKGAGSLLGDGDTGWHVRTGEWILDHGRVPDRDPFSFTRPGAPWFAWEWFWDLLFGWIHRQAGLAAVTFASVVLIAVTFALLYRLALRTSGNALIAIVVTLVAAAASSIHWLARPHLFTLLFVVLFLSALERAAAGEARALWRLPVLTVLWANVHGGFFVGLVLIGAYAIAATGRAWRNSWQRARPFLAAGAACLAASLLNPYGWRLHKHVIEYLTDPGQYRGIQEFQTLSFHAGLSRYFEVLLLAGAGAAFWSFRKQRFANGILMLLWAHLALLAARNIPIFALVAAPEIARAAVEWLGTISGKITERFLKYADEWNVLERIPRWHAASGLCLAVVALGLFHGSGWQAFRAEYDPRRYPAEMVGKIAAAGPGIRVFTHDEWGDYLIYRLYPAARVFVDGRSDFYGSSFGREYESVMRVRAGWKGRLAQYDVNAVLLPPECALAAVLEASGDWTAVQRDGTAVFFRRNEPMRVPKAASMGGNGRGREAAKTETSDSAAQSHSNRGRAIAPTESRSHSL